MGGLGSGRSAERLAARDCRALDLGELCDAGRRLAQVRGEVHWRSERSGQLRGRLTYALTGQDDRLGEDLILAYRYWPDGAGFSRQGEFELEALPGRRTYALCPACGTRARMLYAPPGAAVFRCRTCCGLVYRRRGGDAADLAYVREAAGPAIRVLAALPARSRRRARRRYVEHPPQELARELEEELPLGGEELALWCLRLRAAGLSYRQIAALTECSKSTAARICRVGKRGIDTQALVRERLERGSRLPPLPAGADGPALRAQLSVLRRHALRHGLYGYAAREPEERLLPAGEEPGS